MTQKEDLGVDSIVYLNSGSPKLTVIGLTDTSVQVKWLSGDEFKETSFPYQCVSLIQNGTH